MNTDYMHFEYCERRLYRDYSFEYQGFNWNLKELDVDKSCLVVCLVLLLLMF